MQQLQALETAAKSLIDRSDFRQLAVCAGVAGRNQVDDPLHIFNGVRHAFGTPRSGQCRRDTAESDHSIRDLNHDPVRVAGADQPEAPTDFKSDSFVVARCLDCCRRAQCAEGRLASGALFLRLSAGGKQGKQAENPDAFHYVRIKVGARDRT